MTPTANQHPTCELQVTIKEPRVYTGRLAPKIISPAGTVEYNDEDWGFIYSSDGNPEIQVYCLEHGVELDFDMVIATDPW